MKKLVGIPAKKRCMNCGVGRMMVFGVKGGQTKLGPYERRSQYRCTINGSPLLGCGHSYHIKEEFFGVEWDDLSTPETSEKE